MKVVETNDKLLYNLYEIEYIAENQEDIVKDCFTAVKKINEFVEAETINKDTTWYYTRYNVFSIMPGNIHFFKIFKELQKCVKHYFNYNKISFEEQLWIQSWLNHHTHDTVLSRHNHWSPVHGYLSINPQDTETVFYHNDFDTSEMFAVQNRPGLVYLGPGKREHSVRNLKEYEGTRFTIGFDIDDNDSTEHLGMIPLVI